MKTSFRSIAVTALLALVFGFAGAAAWSFSGLGDNHTRAYLLENPDLLPQMAEAYQRQESQGRVAKVAKDVVAPFPGAEFGNPKGSVTLVEFTDYACGYCRMSQEHVAQLVRDNPDLRIVIREFPIFEGSDRAAGIALAAAKQGKYKAFHDAMFAKGAPSEATIAASAREAGLDMEAAEAFAASDEARAELVKNMSIAQSLGFAGTPSWVVGTQAMEGAVGVETLQKAIDEAKKAL